MRQYLHIFLSLCLLILTTSCGGSGNSSGSSDDAPVSLRSVIVSPSTSRPGNPVQLENFPSLPSGYTWTIALGDTIVPLIKSEAEEYFVPAPLIFKAEDSDWPEIPAHPLDLILYRDGVEEDRLTGVLTLESLLRADGSSEAIEQYLLDIATALAGIGDALASVPGEHQQYISMMIDTFNQMLTGDCDNCLKTQIDLLAQEGCLELLDALLAQGGFVEYFSTLETFFTQYADGLAAIQASSSSSSTLIQPAYAMPEQTDVILAYQMQFYEVIKLFGEEVINATGTQFGNTLGTLIGILGVVGVANPVATTTMTVTSAVLFYMDFLVNKIMVGLLPGQLDSIDLEFASAILDNGETTSSTITIHASNVQPQFTLNELVSTALNMMGWVDSLRPPSLVTTTIESLTVFLSTTMQSFFSQYASNHPELNLNLNLAETVPPITWTAKATDTRLTQCISLAPTLLVPMPDQLNWQADDTLRGEGGVYVRPALGEEARIVPLPPGFTYAGGAFGDNVINSDTVTLTVGELEVNIEILLGVSDDIWSTDIPYMAQSQYYYKVQFPDAMVEYEDYDRAPAEGLPILNFDPDTCAPTGGLRILPGTVQAFLTSIDGACSSARHDTTLELSAESLSGSITLSSSVQADYDAREYPNGCSATVEILLDYNSVVLKIENNTDTDVVLIMDFELFGEFYHADSSISQAHGRFGIGANPDFCSNNDTYSLYGDSDLTEDPNGTGSQTLTIGSGTHYVGIGIGWYANASNVPGPADEDNRASGTVDGIFSFRIQQPES